MHSFFNLSQNVRRIRGWIRVFMRFCLLQNFNCTLLNAHESFFLFGQRTQRGQCPVDYRGNLYVCPRVHLSICPSVVPPSQPAVIGLWMDRWMDRQTDRRMDGQTDGCTHRFPLYLTRHCPLWIQCPAYFKTATAMLMGRARVPLTISRLWATYLILKWMLSTSVSNYEIARRWQERRLVLTWRRKNRFERNLNPIHVFSPLSFIEEKKKNYSVVRVYL